MRFCKFQENSSIVFGVPKINCGSLKIYSVIHKAIQVASKAIKVPLKCIEVIIKSIKVPENLEGNMKVVGCLKPLR